MQKKAFGLAVLLLPVAVGYKGGCGGAPETALRRAMIPSTDPGKIVRDKVQLGFYNRLNTLIFLIYALVLASDWIGERLRLSVA